MKLAVAVTLEGLIRAMRWNAHDLAESVEGDGAARKRHLADDGMPAAPRLRSELAKAPRSTASLPRSTLPNRLA